MILRAEGREFTLHIKYDKPTPGRRKKRSTHVALHEGVCRALSCPSMVARVTVPCSASDAFVKSKGRKIALARAMSSLLPHELNYGLRQALWEDFRRKVGEL